MHCFLETTLERHEMRHSRSEGFWFASHMSHPNRTFAGSLGHQFR